MNTGEKEIHFISFFFPLKDSELKLRTCRYYLYGVGFFKMIFQKQVKCISVSSNFRSQFMHP